VILAAYPSINHPSCARDADLAVETPLRRGDERLGGGKTLPVTIWSEQKQRLGRASMHQ